MEKGGRIDKEGTEFWFRDGSQSLERMPGMLKGRGVNVQGFDVI